MWQMQKGICIRFFAQGIRGCVKLFSDRGSMSQYLEDASMERGKKKYLSVLLSCILLSSMAACGAKETGKEDEAQTQDHIQQQEQSQADEQSRGEEQNTENIQEDEEDGIPGREREAEVVMGENWINDRGPDAAPFEVETVLACEVWDKEKTHVEMPGGILSDGEGLLVCDTKNHCVVRLTSDGEYVESYGERGGESGNFKDPTAILLYENEIYILDSGNRRIQVFDPEMNYVREVEFAGPSVGSGGKYIDMAISADGTIFLSTDGNIGEWAYISYIGEDGTLQIVSGWIVGHLAEEDGTVYAVDRWFFWREGNKTGVSSGENWVYRVEKTGLEKICELPYMYEPTDLIVEDGCLYTLSGTCGKLIRFSMEGEAEEGLIGRAFEDSGWSDVYLFRQDEDIFYVSYAVGYICKTYRAEGEQ